MKDIKKRIKNAERKADMTEKQEFTFIHIHQPEGWFSKRDLERGRIYQKDDFKGLVTLIEKSKRWIDTSSKEGKKILESYGYKPVNN